ncbi:glycosyltransferase family 2 protein [Bacillus methanolicus]|uniref:glycosyltransferase family 2 protein n=1 Tax=Bacillus methanolicus TaxID=1471 RepID=UPI002010171D|nr:glycosyltransferase family A protein [Bacillus methanolicus]
MKPKVSIVIPFFNCQYVNQAIESALNQTYQNIEVIVINDGSTQYVERVTSFLNDNRKINYIEKGNGGTASALNLGIKNMQGDYFVWLSSDDLFTKDKIEKQLHFMEINGYKFSYTNYSLINEVGAKTAERAGVIHPTRKALLAQLQKGCPINGCTVMMSREVINTIGLFDESLTCAQDYDYWLRAIQQYQFGFLNEPLTLYRVHNLMGSHTKRARQRLESTYLVRKYSQTLRRMFMHEK